MYIIEMQYLPKVDNLWVQRLSANDPLYVFDTLEAAETILLELQQKDTSGREYKIKQTFD